MKKLLFILLFFVSSIAYADENNAQLYQVNLIIFSTVTPEALQSEKWPDQLLQPSLKNTINLSFSNNKKNTVEPDMPGLYQLLKYRKKGLRKEASLLRRQQDYNVILHRSWVQPISHNRHTKWVHIIGGKAYDAKGQVISKALLNNGAQPAYWEINGKLKITVLRYFDINAQLNLTLPQTHSDNAFNTIPLQSFSLKQTIRTRSKEIVYFDHPLFGALIQITPAINYE